MSLRLRQPHKLKPPVTASAAADCKKPAAARVVTTKKETSQPRVPFQRLVLSAIGIFIILFEWSWATNHLYSLPEHAIGAFTSITINSLYVVATLVIFFVTGQVIYNWVNQTTTQIVQQTQHVFDRHEVDVTERIVAPKYYDDESIP